MDSEKLIIEPLRELKAYAKLLDSQFKIPKTNFSFGIDPLLSFIPIVGTFSGLLTGCVLIFMAHRKHVSGKVKVLMFRNLVIDYIFGLFPVVGNIKDFFYKANIKNVALLEAYYQEGKHRGNGMLLFAFYLVVLISITILWTLAVLFFVKILVDLLNSIFPN